MLREASLILLGVLIHKATRFISHLLYSNQALADDDSCNDDVILSQTGSPRATKYDVFLSFRGEDIRQTFASHLYKELRNVGIHTFMDHELRKGEEISPVLLRTIEESEISVIIFSKNYASSTWCMNELVHILDCKKKFGRVVIPIFYKVDPSNIRKQNGSFGNGFDVLKRRFKDNQEKLQKWRKALIQSTSLCGLHFNSTRPEFKFIEEIAKDILSKLDYKSSSHLERLVGISCHIEDIEKLLIEARIVGIWGMGGSGKTTLAKALFQEVKAQFDSFSFVENVKDQLSRISSDELQRNCLKELLKDGDINIYDIKSNSVKSRLHHKKVLLILDDVDNSVIGEDLAQVCDWFGEGSRIIITSRNQQVLKNASAFSTYHVSNLDFHDALYLFSLKAFKQHEPFEGYMELSKSVVEYCQGNPLALVVLGCFLYGRGKAEWESALEKLNEAPPKDVVDVLKLSFDGLDDKQQNVFLDMAFLVKGGVRISVNVIRQIHGSSVDIEISVLREKSLISLDNHTDCIGMHNLVMKMGLEIARQQLFSCPETPIRLWRHEDVYDFFIRDKGIETIRYLSMDLSKIRRIAWRASNFRKMHNLIFLKVHKSDGRNPSKLTIYDNLDYLPEELRFFMWEEYPFSHVPLHFCSENLITLRMPNSNIRQFWNENQHFPNLKEISLWNSKHLNALPDLSHVPKIKHLFVYGCAKLDQIYSSTVLSNLVELWAFKDGPTQINIGGSMKGTRSGLVMVYNYLNLYKGSWNKVIMKVLVCGDIICGVGFKHVEMPLAEIAELRYLFPFVRVVGLLEGLIQYDFKQHYDYDYDYDYHGNHWGYDYDGNLWGFRGGVRIKVTRRGDKGGERHVMGTLTRKMINDCHHQTSMEAIEGGGGEEEENEELMSSNATIFTRIPNIITHWSLLTKLRLRKSDSILKSLSLSHSLSRASCKPRIVATFSLHIPPSAFTDPRGYFGFSVEYCKFRLFKYLVIQSRARHRDFGFIFDYIDN
ncbi:hypothetical protein QN277_005601 [Acacia crassicarpa]|uniref:TIR domain-containing protein n=1 Tax=Acacia crassicarpa TaxID=499986 RepID=A0AAE1MEF0_9FABA|nr:hypothetical protein QN277_005601 [Acacia crassicarpa]